MESENTCYLCLIMDKHFKFNSHVEHDTKHISKYLCLIRRLSLSIKTKLLPRVHHSIFIFKVNYAIQIWEKASSTYKNIFILQISDIRSDTSFGYLPSKPCLRI